MSSGGKRPGAGRPLGLAKLLTERELDVAQAMLQDGKSLEEAALEVSRQRGADSYITPEVRRRRRVSARTLERRLVQAGRIQSRAEIKAAQKAATSRQLAGEGEQRDPEAHQERGDNRYEGGPGGDA